MNRKIKHSEEILPEYDFSNGIRGKYAKQFETGTNIIVLAPDVAKNFPDSDIVNETLRAIAKIAQHCVGSGTVLASHPDSTRL